jgi:hypothetical protein
VLPQFAALKVGFVRPEPNDAGRLLRGHGSSQGRNLSYAWSFDRASLATMVLSVSMPPKQVEQCRLRGVQLRAVVIQRDANAPGQSQHRRLLGPVTS